MEKYDVNELKVFDDELIKVYETDTGELIVDGRELWQGVKAGTEFSHWVKRRLDECDATEGKDFATVVKKDGRQTLNEVLQELLKKRKDDE